MALLSAAVPPSWYHVSTMVTCSNKVLVGGHQCTTDQLHCCTPPGHQDFIRPNSPTSKYRSSLYSSTSPTGMWLVSKGKDEGTFFETFLRQLGEMVFRTRVVRAVGMALLSAAVPPSWYHLVMVTCSNKVQVGVPPVYH